MDYPKIILSFLNTEHRNIFYTKANALLKADYFLESESRIVWVLIQSIVKLTGNLPTDSIFYDILSRTNKLTEEQKDTVRLYFADIRNSKAPSLDSFQYAIRMLIDAYKKKLYMNVLVEASTAVETPIRVDNKQYVGFSGSVALLKSKLIGIEAIGNKVGDEVTSEGMWEEYEEAKKNPDSVKGMLTGIDFFDKYLYGGKKKEVWLMLGYTGEGKSMLTSNLVWHAKVKQKKNVVLFAGEMNLKNYLRRIIVRHSWHKKFGLDKGLVYNQVRYGKLGSYEEKVYQDVLEDYESKEYGQLRLLPIPMGSTPLYIWSKLMDIQQEIDLDGVFIDRLGLLAPERRRQSLREEIISIMQSFRQQSIDFNDGKGLFYTIVHQVNRYSWEAALKCGTYKKNAGAESDEVEKSVDAIIWILCEEGRSGSNQRKIGISKNREDIGELASFSTIDFTRSYIGNFKEEDDIIL